MGDDFTEALDTFLARHEKELIGIGIRVLAAVAARGDDPPSPSAG